MPNTACKHTRAKMEPLRATDRQRIRDNQAEMTRLKALSADEVRRLPPPTKDSAYFFLSDLDCVEPCRFTLEEVEQATAIARDVRANFGRHFTKGDYECSVSERNGRLHVIVWVPCRCIGECRQLLAKEYPNPAIPFEVDCSIFDDDEIV